MSKALVLLLLACAAPVLEASELDLITINTASLPAATKGYVDFLFNGGGTKFDPATASITNFSGGTLNPASISRTAATGTLPAPVLLTNSNGEYLEGITFGAGISFYLQLSGTAVDSPSGTAGSGSTFTLSLLNATQDGAYLTSDQTDGFILEFNIDTRGNITHTTFPTESGAPSVVSVQAVPEPGTWLLCCAAFGIVAFVHRVRVHGIR